MKAVRSVALLFRTFFFQNEKDSYMKSSVRGRRWYACCTIDNRSENQSTKTTDFFFSYTVFPANQGRQPFLTMESSGHVWQRMQRIFPQRGQKCTPRWGMECCWVCVVFFEFWDYNGKQNNRLESWGECEPVDRRMRGKKAIPSDERKIFRKQQQRMTKWSRRLRMRVQLMDKRIQSTDDDRSGRQSWKFNPIKFAASLHTNFQIKTRS